MNSRLIIAAGDISGTPVLLKQFRGKTAKEVYRCGKGIVFTGSVRKSIAFAAVQIPGELTKGVVYTAVGQVGEAAIGYISGIGVARYLYKVVQPAKLKATVRLFYNLMGLPLTLYSKGIGGACDLFQLSKLEKIWFGTPVYIFDDNRIWIESNFTLSDIFESVDEF